MPRTNPAAHIRVRRAPKRALILSLAALTVGAMFHGSPAGAASGHNWLQISGSPPPSVVAGTSYVFQPSVSARSGTEVSFSVTDKPDWATFSITTGRLSGTPTAAQTGTYSDIVISASDGSRRASLPAFSITVNAASTPPSISGTPATSVNVGATYAFTPSATAGSGGTLSFSISNGPAWATFSASTGALTGVPTAAAVGAYPGIVISVSNASGSASLAAFSITVSEPQAPGSANLSWVPPTENTDGTPLTNLAGYRIEWGASAGSLSQSVTIANAGLTTYEVTALAPGTWYFAVQAYTTAGTYGLLSNVVSQTIQ
jgi:Putative Ig domain